MVRARLSLLTVAAMAAFMGWGTDEDRRVSIVGVAAAQVRCSDGMPGNTRKCVIQVDATIVGSACEVSAPNPEFLTLSNAGHRNLTVVWRLGNDNGDFVFCARSNDGVFLKNPAHEAHAQVNRAWAANNAGEEDTQPDQTACKKRFRWNFKNKQTSDAPPGTEYDYVLRFRDKSGTVRCEKDPWIKNGSPTFVPPPAKSR